MKKASAVAKKQQIPDAEKRRAALQAAEERGSKWNEKLKGHRKAAALEADVRKTPLNLPAPSKETLDRLEEDRKHLESTGFAYAQSSSVDAASARAALDGCVMVVLRARLRIMPHTSCIADSEVGDLL